MKQTFTLILALLTVQWAGAQKLELEKTYEISGKAKRGTLDYVAFDPETETYELNYVTKSTDKKAKFEAYVFDKDFNFIEMIPEEIEFEKARKKFSWFRFGGDLEADLLTVENNLTGQIVLKQGTFINKYDWYNGVYWSSFKTLKKVKPKDPQGRRLTMLTHRTDAPQQDITYFGWSWLWPAKKKTFSGLGGDVAILCKVLPKLKDMKAGPMNDYAVQRWGAGDLSLKAEKKFSFQYPQVHAHASAQPNGDFAAIFASSMAGGKKGSDDPLNYNYVRANSITGEVLHKTPFKSKNSYWDITAVTDKGEDTYIYGPANSKKNDKHYDLQVGAPKFSDFQIARFRGGTMDMISNTTLEDFDAKIKTPPSQKKTPSYSGKRFTVGGLETSTSGDILISGQNYKKSDEGNQYKDLMVFHFNDDGALKAQYGLDIKESNKYAKATFTESLFLERTDGKGMYWIVLEVAGAKGSDDRFRALMYPRVAMIDLESASVNDFIALGQEKGDKYYLANNFPILPLDTGDRKLVFFGSDRGGKNIWFGRMDIE